MNTLSKKLRHQKIILKVHYKLVYTFSKSQSHATIDEVVILIIQGREKVPLIHGGREKGIWVGDRKKVNGVECQGPGVVRQGKVRSTKICWLF